jgi:hypothetical protein
MLRDVLGRRAGGALAVRQAGGERSHGTAPSAPARWPNPVTALAGVITRHWLFCVALGLALVPRLFAILGYRPAILFRMDTYDYLWNAVHLTPNSVNPSGYALVLALLRPFHSLTLIAILQNLAGLIIALLVYATLRHWGVADWIATLAALPVLFAAPELLLEQLIMADLLALLLMIAAFAVLLMRRSPSVWRSATAGLLMGASAMVRPTTLPLILVMAVYLLIVRAGWRRACALLVAGAVPVLGYMSWFAAANGSFNVTDSNGLFLWSRTMSFANCAVIKPPADLRALCPEVQPHSVTRPPGAPRLAPTKYLWDHRAWQWQPPSTKPVPDASAFTAANNSRALRFALRATEAQPLDYARVVSTETLRPLLHGIGFLFPTNINGGGLPREYVPYALAGVREYTGTTQQLPHSLGSHLTARITEPWAQAIQDYQRVIFLPEPVFALILLAGLAGLFIPRRRTAAAGMLWLSAVIILVLPVAEHEYTYRYALPAIPLACMALALVFRKLPAAAAARTGSPAAATANGRRPATTADRTAPVTAADGMDPATTADGTAPATTADGADPPAATAADGTDPATATTADGTDLATTPGGADPVTAPDSTPPAPAGSDGETASAVTAADGADAADASQDGTSPGGPKEIIP